MNNLIIKALVIILMEFAFISSLQAHGPTCSGHHKNDPGCEVSSPSSVDVHKVVVDDDTVNGSMTIYGTGFTATDVTEVGGVVVNNSYDNGNSTLTIQLSAIATTAVVNEVSNVSLVINGGKEFSVYFPEPIIAAGICPCEGDWINALAGVATDDALSILSDFAGSCDSTVTNTMTGNIAVSPIQNNFPEFYSFGTAFDSQAKYCNLITYEGVNVLGTIFPDLANPTFVFPAITPISQGEYLGCKQKIQELFCP